MDLYEGSCEECGKIKRLQIIKLGKDTYREVKITENKSGHIK